MPVEKGYIALAHLNVLRHVPGEVDHGHDGLVPLALVPLVPLDSCHVLPGDANYDYYLIYQYIYSNIIQF